MTGWRYTLELAESPRFRAAGLDVATRIARRVEVALEQALADDPELAELELGGSFRVASPSCTGDVDCLANLHDRDCSRRRR